MGITGKARRNFGDYIESIKKESGKFNNTNFSWKEIVEYAKEFISRRDIMKKRKYVIL